MEQKQQKSHCSISLKAFPWETQFKIYSAQTWIAHFTRFIPLHQGDAWSKYLVRQIMILSKGGFIREILAKSSQ